MGYGQGYRSVLQFTLFATGLVIDESIGSNRCILFVCFISIDQFPNPFSLFDQILQLFVIFLCQVCYSPSFNAGSCKSFQVFLQLHRSCVVKFAVNIVSVSRRSIFLTPIVILLFYLFLFRSSLASWSLSNTSFIFLMPFTVVSKISISIFLCFQF